MGARRCPDPLASPGDSAECDYRSGRSAPDLVVLAPGSAEPGLVCGESGPTRALAGEYRKGSGPVVYRTCPTSRDRSMGYDPRNGAWSHADHGHGTDGRLFDGYGCDDGSHRLDGQCGLQASLLGVDVGTSRTGEHGTAIGDALALAAPIGMAVYLGGASIRAHYGAGGSIDPVGFAAQPRLERFHQNKNSRRLSRWQECRIRKRFYS